jgi:predicted nucleotidyltransferase
MKDKDRGVALELKNRLAGLVKLVDFSVFGSRARGDAGEDSDMDVFIEVENLDKDMKRRVQDAAWEVGFENFIVISPLIFTRDELENSPLRSSPIVRVIKEEGAQI